MPAAASAVSSSLRRAIAAATLLGSSASFAFGQAASARQSPGTEEPATKPTTETVVLTPVQVVADQGGYGAATQR